VVWHVISVLYIEWRSRYSGIFQLLTCIYWFFVSFVILALDNLITQMMEGGAGTENRPVPAPDEMIRGLERTVLLPGSCVKFLRVFSNFPCIDNFYSTSRSYFSADLIFLAI